MVSLVIPIFNEAESLPELSKQIVEAASLLGEKWEAIFVDDGSRDATPEVLVDLADSVPQFKVVRLRRNFGKAAALDAGFAYSRGDRIVTLDADLQDDPAEVKKLVEALDGGYDLVSGWKHNRKDPWHKRAPSRLFNWATARLSGVKLHDFNCGLKAYRSTVAKELVLYGELYRYIPVICYQQGWRVTELEVNHRARLHGKSKFGRERYLRGLFDLLTVLFMGRYRYRPLHLFGGFGLAMFALGLVISAYMTVLKIQGEAIGTRPLLLLGVLLIVVGVQFLSFGLVSEMIAANRETQTKEDSTRLRVESVYPERLFQNDSHT